MADAAKDIFGLTNTVAPFAFHDPTDNSGIFTMNGKELTLVQQWTVNYQQQVTPVYECGTSTVYFAGKHASGTLSVGRIIADTPLEMLQNLGTVCKQANGSIKAYTGTCEGGSQGGAEVTLELNGMLATSVGFSGQAQNSYVTEDVQVMFSFLTVNGGGVGVG